MGRDHHQFKYKPIGTLKGVEMRNVWAVVWALIVLSFSSNLVAGEKKILNIASYHPDTSWAFDCVEGIESVVSSQYHLENHYMDTKRIPVSEFQKTADMAWEKYRTFKPDLIMVGDDNALRLLGPRLAETKMPLVHYGVNNNPRAYFDGQIPDNVYGVLERPLIFPLMRYLKDIIPGLIKILVMFDVSSSSDAVITATFHGKQSVSLNNVIFDLNVTGNWNGWQNILTRSQNEYQAIIIVNHFTIKTADGKTLADRAVIRQSSLISPVPVFATNNFAVHSQGAVGALVIVGQDHGKAAGTLAEAILEGKINIIRHITQKAGQLYFNKEQLDRFNLKLPRNIEKKVIFQ
jgi:ABC-type uncharacterized transport system substrate-binding protein